MNFDILILGTSSATPTTNRFPTSHIVNIYGVPMLLDCGEGTQLQLRRFHISFGSIQHIFISHLHGDHYYGLFGLLSTYKLFHREAVLNLYGPEELKNILWSKYSPVKVEELDFEVNFHVLPKEGGIILDHKNFTVEAIPLYHSIETWGFIFREKRRLPNIIKSKIEEFNLSIEEIVKLKNGQIIVRSDGQIITPEHVTLPPPLPRAYAYISDTKFLPKLAEKLKDIDLLYHEATFDNEHKQKAINTLHSTSEQAAMLAKQANVGKLVIGHFSITIEDMQSFYNQAKAIFSNTILAYDGLKLSIPQKSNLKK